MDGSRELNLDALRHSLATAGHLLFRFGPLTERLFIDFRSTDTAGPGVFILDQASSFTDRVASIKQLRPDFPDIERLQVVSWPLPVAALGRLGVIEAARSRLAGMDAFDALRQLDDAYAQLVRLEHDELRRAITGEGYHTLWPSARHA